MRNPFVLAALAAVAMQQVIADRNLALFRAGVPLESYRLKTGARYPHHNTGECARRRRQIDRGILRPSE